MKFQTIIATLISITWANVSFSENACYLSQIENEQLIAYSIWIRKEDPKNAEAKINYARSILEGRANLRCEEEEKKKLIEADKQRRVKLYFQKKLFTPNRSGVPKVSDPLPPAPLPETYGFWCRAESKECFSSENECQLDGLGNLFDCGSRSLAACSAYATLGGIQVACFSSTEACNNFCWRREEPFDGKFACFNSCDIL
jgi:hypothetical protein